MDVPNITTVDPPSGMMMTSDDHNTPSSTKTMMVVNDSSPFSQSDTVGKRVTFSPFFRTFELVDLSVGPNLSSHGPCLQPGPSSSCEDLANSQFPVTPKSRKGKGALQLGFHKQRDVSRHATVVPSKRNYSQCATHSSDSVHLVNLKNLKSINREAMVEIPVLSAVAEAQPCRSP